MKAFLVLGALLFSNLCFSETRNPIFGVYRGLSAPTVSCTLAIIEQRPVQGAAVLIDQNPYLYVSTSELMAMISGNSRGMTLNSMEANRQGTVEFVLDAKKNVTEVRTVFSGQTAKCSKVFQIRRQDD